MNLHEVKGFFGSTDPIGEGSDPGSAYITSMYWTIATMTAVGYGDISATNDVERFFSILTRQALPRLIIFAACCAALDGASYAF
mgnify:CR=1 FL=1